MRLYQHDDQGNGFRRLNDAIEKISRILERARDELDAEDSRFRRKDWEDKSVVPVSPWSKSKEQKNKKEVVNSKKHKKEIDPRLIERVYYNPENPLEIDCLVGLVARIERIKEEKSKKDKNQKLINKLNLDDLKIDEKLKNELKKDTSEIQKLVNKLKESFKKDQIYFDEPGRETVFLEFIEKIKRKIADYDQKEKIWKEYHNTLYTLLKKSVDYKNNPPKFFETVFTNPKAPWEKGKNRKQWEQLKDYLLYEKHSKDPISEFLEAVKKTYEGYEELKIEYVRYKKSREKITCEIVVPVNYLDQFVGVLNFHIGSKSTKNNAVDIAKKYADELAFAYLYWQGILHEEFLEVAQKITALESNFPKIASEIAKGIRAGLVHSLKNHEVYPIFYVPDKSIGHLSKLDRNYFEEIYDIDTLDSDSFKKIWEVSYQRRYGPEPEEDPSLLIKEDELGPIRIREDGLGWRIINQWRTIKEKDNIHRYFITCNDVDDPNSKTGSRSAWDHGILTTGCLPLIFEDMVYGLLYLHCYKKRHLFSAAELKALNILGTHAAIAIKNARIIGESYEKLYGEKLLDHLIEEELR